MTDALPDGLRAPGAFLRAQLAPYPGRANLMLRCVLASAIAIVISMTLEVPSLALSLLVVFYVTQSNVVVTRLVGAMFMVGSTLAIGLSIVMLKLTFDYPLLRIVVAGLLFLGSVYLMRIVKFGTVFFIVAIVIIYVQSFVDMTDRADLLVRSVLWVWVAVNYPIALTLLINTLFLPAKPEEMLKAEMRRQLRAVDARLAQAVDAGSPVAAVGISATQVQYGALALQKLLKFTAMRNARYRDDEVYELARIATVSRLYRAASELLPFAPARPAAVNDALRTLRDDCRALDDAIAAGRRYRIADREARSSGDVLFAGGAAAEMRRALDAFSDLAAPAAAQERSAAKDPVVAADALTNPTYVRFSLKTLLAVMLCYVFYNATDWQGAHTIMLTCIIIALPSLGASVQRALLRVSGALTGSALALFMVVFVIPHLDGIAGLLLVTLPVAAFSAWIAAGSERVSYAGVQIMFTFSLALLEQFGPTSNLTEIRDRMVGIVLGVGVSTLIQVGFWREEEGDALRQKLAGLLRTVVALSAGKPADDGLSAELPYATQQWQARTALAECESLLVRVALEPNWQEGEHAQITLRAQTILAQAREIARAGNALRNELEARPAGIGAELVEAVRAARQQAAQRLATYADGLAANPPAAQRPSGIAHALPDAERDAAESHPLLDSARDLVRQIAGLPDWRVSISSSSPGSGTRQHD